MLINTSNNTYLHTLIKNFDSIKEYNLKCNREYGIDQINLDENKGLIVLKFDDLNIKKQNVDKLILEGYVSQNLSQLNYSYSDNPPF